MRLTKPLILLMVLVFLSGCSFYGSGAVTRGMRVDERKGKDTSFVFGYIDLVDGKPTLDWVKMLEVQTGKQAKVHYMRASGWVFYLENVKNGSYRIDSFGGQALSFFYAGNLFATHPVIYSIPRKDQFWRFKIDQPGIYFLGRWKWREVETGFFEADKWDVDKIDKPSPAEMIKAIKPYLKNTQWEGILTNYAKSQK